MRFVVKALGITLRQASVLGCLAEETSEHGKHSANIGGQPLSEGQSSYPAHVSCVLTIRPLAFVDAATRQRTVQQHTCGLQHAC